jgi:hypothetical protein
MLNTTKTSDLVSSQFPTFYKDEGSNFIEFVKTYYEWMESQGYDRSSVDLPSTLDIDTTADKFLDNFKNTYMNGLPSNILGNQRLLQKHILDIYRSKGSIQGLKLLYRLIYNEDVEVYIPSYDIFKTSDGKWIQRKYIEINLSDKNRLFEGNLISGVASGATAFVDAYERRIINGVLTDIFFVTDVHGNFLLNENIFSEDIPIDSSIFIRGSVVGFNVTSSNPSFSIGEKVYDKNNPSLKYVVTSLQSSSDGVIVPLLIDGGKGYSLNKNNYTVSYTVGANNTGTNFSVEIGSIKDVETLSLSYLPLAPYANVALNSSDYGMPGPGAETLTSLIGLAIQSFDVDIGTIDTLLVTNPGSLYIEDIGISIIDNLITPLNIPDNNGGVYGNDAIITGPVSVGRNRANAVSVKNSDYNYELGETVTLVSELNPNKSIFGNIQLGSLGVEEGFYRGTDGFTSSNKFLQDSFYYQEYSYEVISTRTLSKYFSVLQSLSHPVGNELFGSVLVSSTNNASVDIANFTIDINGIPYGYTPTTQDGVQLTFNGALIFDDGLNLYYHTPSIPSGYTSTTYNGSQVTFNGSPVFDDGLNFYYDEDA